MKNSTPKIETKLDRKEGLRELINLMRVGKIEVRKNEVNNNGWAQ